MTTALLDYDVFPIKLKVESDPERELRIRSCAKEAETVRWIGSLPSGSVLFDIGANVGAYSLIAASRGIRVHAFEPHPATFARLEENVALNGLKVRCHQELLHSADELVSVSWSSDEPGAAMHRLGSEGDQVVGVRLDGFVGSRGLPAPSYLKVDVDGWEEHVFRGAEAVLSYCKGVLWEFDPRLDQSYRALQFLIEQDLRFEAAHPHASGVVNVIMGRTDPSESLVDGS